MLLCIPRPQRAAYLLADVVGLTDVEGAEVLDCSREAFRQRASRARRTLRYVIDNRCGLVDPANPCRCGRQIAPSERAGILRRDCWSRAEHPREEVRVWIEPVAGSSTRSSPSATCTGSTVSRRRTRCGTTSSGASRRCSRRPRARIPDAEERFARTFVTP
jgi:hypothetical protein